MGTLANIRSFIRVQPHGGGSEFERNSESAETWARLGRAAEVSGARRNRRRSLDSPSLLQPRLAASKETPEIARRAVGSRYDRCSGGRRSSAAVARCNRGAVTPTASWAFAMPMLARATAAGLGSESAS